MASNTTSDRSAAGSRGGLEGFASYGFAIDPYGPDLTTEFLFLTESLRQRQDLILHLIEFSTNPVVVVGDEGSGKSALLRTILKRAASSWRTLVVESSPKTTLAAVAHKLADTLSMRLAGDDPNLDWRLVRDRLCAMAGSGATVVALLDDAETLPSEVLRQLLELVVAGGAESAFRLVLAIRGRETDRLSLPLPEGFDATKINRIAMPVFSPDQIEAYIDARFAAAGLSGTSPLAGSALDWIRLQSAGIPGRADALARRALQSPETVPAAPWFDPDRLRAMLRSVPSWSWAAVGGVVVLAAVASFWQSSLANRDPYAVERIADPGSATRSFQLTLPEAESPPASKVESGAATASQSIPTPPQPAPVAASEKAEQVQASIDEIPSPPVPARRPEASELPGSAQPNPKAAPPPTRAASASPGATAKLEVSWLLAQPESGYSIQLLAAFDREAVRRYLLQHGMETQGFILEAKRNGRPWYIATHGYFPTRAQANAALAQLPEAVRREQPWPRTIVELRAAVQP